MQQPTQGLYLYGASQPYGVRPSVLLWQNMEMAMKVYMPYSYIHQPTINALTDHVGDFCCVKMDGEEDYWGYFLRRWYEREGFINVEHDVVIKQGQISSLLKCPQHWCCFPEAAGAAPSLSLAKFSGIFIKDHPRLWTLMGKTNVSVHWSVVDTWLNSYTNQLFIKPHLHGPPYADNQRPKGSLH